MYTMKAKAAKVTNWGREKFTNNRFYKIHHYEGLEFSSNRLFVQDIK